MAVKYADARRFALSLPGVSEEPHFGVPSFRVNKRMLVTVPPGNMLHVFVPDADRDMLLDMHAGCTDKVYWGGKVVGIRIFLDKATRGAVEDLVLRAWKARAPKKVVAAYASSPLPATPKQREGGTRESGVGKRAGKTLGPGVRRGDDGKSVGKAQVADTVDAYIATFPPPVRARLDKVRATIRKAAPAAEEAISYRIPAYRLDGSLVYFAGFAQHIGLYPAPRDSLQFRDELAAYAGGKGTVQFPHDKPLPLDLIRRIVQFRAAGNATRTAANKKKGKRGVGSSVRKPSAKAAARKPNTKVAARKPNAKTAAHSPRKRAV